MFPDDLIRKINSGRCFVLVGSGPSSEVGYLSWPKLAEVTLKELESKGLVSDPPSYKKFLETSRFAEVFQLAEKDIGSRDALMALLKANLFSGVRKDGRIYQYLLTWPFACYLTTNYDDELPSQLTAAGLHFETLLNRKEDFYNIRDGASGFVVKLHADLDHPTDAIVTSDDYRRLETGAERLYFRDKLRSIFEIFDILVIGHSFSDRDLQLIVQTAKEIASPKHPIYLALPNLTVGEISEFRRAYNIVVIPYNDPDGTHRELLRDLRVANKFIGPRGRFVGARTTPPPAAETQAATSLLIFRRLRSLAPSGASSAGELYAPVVLMALAAASGEKTLQELITTPPVALLANNPAAQQAVQDSLDILVKQAFATTQARPSRYSVTETGREKVSEIASVRLTEEKQAFSEFSSNIRSLFPKLSASEDAECVALARDAIVAVFRKRGLSIASSVFADRSVSPADFGDIFTTLSTVSVAFENGDLRAAFLEAARDLIVDPSDAQKRYLESVSQGFFLYHLAGLDPSCTRVRRELIAETAWFLDSSVLLPWIAIGSHSYDYAEDMFRRLTDLGAQLLTTDKLLQETWEHLQWAINHAHSAKGDPLGMLDAALVHTGFKQNLFIDGYIRLSAEGSVGSFEDYLARIAPKGLSRAKLDAEITRRGVKVVELRSFDGFDPIDLGELPELEAQIEQQRKSKGTFRSERQVAAEAEVLYMIRQIRSGRYKLGSGEEQPERVYFASQSRVLDRVPTDDPFTTWTPEAMYRYVTALPGEVSDPDLLQKCMVHEYYWSGIRFIDESRYKEYFGPAIRDAKLAFEEEKERYVAEVERAADLDVAFEQTPDLEKPFFVSQMTRQIADAATARAAVLLARVIEAEEKIASLEEQRTVAWKKKAKARAREEKSRKRQAKNPAHRKKKARQAKKKSKKRSR